MSEIIAPPSAWTVHTDVTESQLRSFLGDKRLISIKSYVKNGARLYSGVSVVDGVPGAGWVANITPSELAIEAEANQLRVISLDCFWDEGPNELRCAAVWTSAGAGHKTSFKWDMIDSDVDGVREVHGKPICIRTYQPPADPGQHPPIAFLRRYCAVWIPDEGQVWNWAHDIKPVDLGLKLDDENGRLVSVDSDSPLDWSGKDETVTAVWWRNVTGDVWFWNIGFPGSQLRGEILKGCSYGVDVAPAGPRQFISLMYQYPKPVAPGATALVDFNATLTTVQQDDESQDISLVVKQTSLSPQTVTYTEIQVLYASEGGWCWSSPSMQPLTPGARPALPFSLPPGSFFQTNDNSGTTTNLKYGIFGLRAEDGLGGFQNRLIAVPAINSGLPAPGPLSLSWPVFLGLIEPVEYVHLTNGRGIVTVQGQVCNPTGQPLSVTNVYIRLRDNRGMVQEVKLGDKLALDLPTEPLGDVTDKSNSLANFYVALPAVEQFAGGHLKVQINVKYGGALECYGDGRELVVQPAPTIKIPRLPYDPLPNPGPGDPTLRWRWANGVGSQGMHWHSFPEHRYSYDLTVCDESGNFLPTGADKSANPNYFAWGRTIRAVENGVLVFVDDSNPDNMGNVMLPNPTANIMVVYNAANDAHYLYVHMSQGSATDDSGTHWLKGMPVRAGDKLASVGNAGNSSGPHLHFGVSRRDANGFLRPMPIELSNVTDGAGNQVRGVAADGETYS